MNKGSDKIIENPIVELGQFIQKNYQKSILTRVTGKYGPDHSPTITAEIILPSGKIFKGDGPNQREAKRLAALRAIESINNMELE